MKCKGRAKFVTAERATWWASRARRIYGGWLYPYKCSKCGGWHAGLKSQL